MKLKKLVPQTLINYGKHLPTAVAANLKYGFPSDGIKVIGVTGTDGKTTTVNMIYQVLKAAGKKVSMVSTINAVLGDEKLDTGFHVTNPDPMALQSYISKAKAAGSEYLVLEVTSHGLDQFRVWGIHFEIGVITNITHEHLDYHKTFDNYLQAKAKLIQKANWAVLNYDDKSFSRLKNLAVGKVISYGRDKSAEININKLKIKTNLAGEYNELNAAAAIGVAQIIGINQKVAQDALLKMPQLTGRMEEIPNKLGVRIVVDFAHTPNALESALMSLRPLTKKRLISVFGAASLRDEKKRPMMGKISGRLADITVLTDEDPRFEDSMIIINQIAVAVEKVGGKEGKNLFKIPDRAKAIYEAIKMAKPGDTVGIFGKGHETSMNYQGVEKPWSDRKAVEMAVKSIK